MTIDLREYISGLMSTAVPAKGSELQFRVAALACDVIGAARSAAGQPELRQAAPFATVDGPCSTVLEGGRSSVHDAAFWNATAATWNELDEGYRGAGHPGAHVVCAALALGEQLRSSGSAVLGAIARGYQLQVALSETADLLPEVHTHGALGAPAAALAAASLLGFDTERAATSVDIAANLAPAGLFVACTEGNTVRHTFAGTGAQVGIRSALLAASGFTAPANSCETAYGQVRGSAFRGWAEPSGAWAIGHGYLKTWSSCAFTHTVLDVVNDIVTDHRPQPSQVDRVEVTVPAVAAQLSGLRYSSPLAVRFSLPVLVALLLSGRDVRDPATCESVPHDVIVLAERVRVVEDPELTAEWPHHAWARVRIHTADGATLFGTRSDPVTPTDDRAYVSAVIDKLDRLATMSPDQSMAVIDALISAPQVPFFFGPDDLSGLSVHRGQAGPAARFTGVAS